MFTETYPHIARWVNEHGWIEMGFDEQNESFIKALDLGGLIWEGEHQYPSVDAALQALENALDKWLKEQFEE